MDIVEILDRYAEGDEFQRPIETAIEEITKLREQVAAQAAVIEKLLTFVKYVAEQTPEKPDYWSSCGQCSSNSDEAEDLLAIPTDSTQILDEVRRAERERVAQFVDDNCTYGDTHILVKAIRAMGDE